MQGVATACVGPHFREGDFGAGSLLQEQLILGIEQEDAEGSVQLPLWLLSCESVYVILASVPCDAVFVIDKYALIFVHEVLLCSFACNARVCCISAASAAQPPRFALVTCHSTRRQWVRVPSERMSD